MPHLLTQYLNTFSSCLDTFLPHYLPSSLSSFSLSLPSCLPTLPSSLPTCLYSTPPIFYNALSHHIYIHPPLVFLGGIPSPSAACWHVQVATRMVSQAQAHSLYLSAHVNVVIVMRRWHEVVGKRKSVRKGKERECRECYFPSFLCFQKHFYHLRLTTHIQYLYWRPGTTHRRSYRRYRREVPVPAWTKRNPLPRKYKTHLHCFFLDYLLLPLLFFLPSLLSSSVLLT